jgi:large subunit ribosomal protein L25
MQRVQLEVSAREATGKGVARKLRASGRIPAIVYGTGVDPVALSVDRLALDKIVQRSVNALVDLKGPRAVDGRLALLKELQRDPLRRRLLHCDLYLVDPNKPITVSVPVHFEGKPRGVEQGGVLEPLLRELEVSCLPMAIPEVISVDVSQLDIGHSLHVGELALPEGVRATAEPERAVVHVITPRLVEEAEAAPAEAAAVVEGAPAPAEPGAESG